MVSDDGCSWLMTGEEYCYRLDKIMVKEGVDHGYVEGKSRASGEKVIAYFVKSQAVPLLLVK